jgi:8-oxo-dGTP pyrophosphatase MutT (NUDIX family)
MASGGPGPPVVRRTAARLVVLDTDSKILLLHIRDLGNPAFGTSWELPGGGLEPGETFADAAIRELWEETGIRVTPDRAGEPTWQRDASYLYRGARRVQHEMIAAVRLSRPAPEVLGSYRRDFEGTDHFGFRWWPMADIVTSPERFYPRRLPTLLPRFLAGERIDEPVEFWP